MMLRADGNLTDLDEITTTRGLDGESWTVRLTAPQLRSVNVQWFNGGASFPAGGHQSEFRGAHKKTGLSPLIDWRIRAKKNGKGAGGGRGEKPGGPPTKKKKKDQTQRGERA